MSILSVIKYDGSSDVFAWKHPNQELGTWSQLIVNESQEAILYKGGQALDSFGPGRHTLDTNNIPILGKLINLPFGKRSPFTAEVWYINKVCSLDVKWGTPTPIQLQDPKYKVFIPLRSYGQFGIQIEDARKFLIKLVGTMSVFNKENVLAYFRGLYLTTVKDAISSYLINKQISILEINAYLEELSQHLKSKVLPIMSEYGIKLLNFYVNDISVSENDSAVIKLKDALAKRAEMDIVGYDYVQERSFNTLEGAANNPGGGQSGIMGAGIGLGMGAGIGSVVGSQMGGISNNINIKPQKNCPKCNASIEKAKRFCSECGCDTENRTEDNEVTCSNCKCKYSTNVKFCPQCGDTYNPCPKCKADVEKGADKCNACGYPMPKPCPKCGVMTNDSAKFCHDCGATLVRKCSKCDAEISGTPKFCPECGNKL